MRPCVPAGIILRQPQCFYLSAKKRKALLKAQTPETPDARAAINDEIATLAAETNRLAAKLAKLKAEEALVLQSGGGDGGGS